jgi:hypothetical protein
MLYLFHGDWMRYLQEDSNNYVYSHPYCYREHIKWLYGATQQETCLIVTNSRTTLAAMNWDYVPFNKNKAIGKLEFNFKIAYFSFD